MKKFTIECEYKSLVTLVVEVKDGLDPMNPDNWGEFLQETETDYLLQDVLSAEEIL